MFLGQEMLGVIDLPDTNVWIWEDGSGENLIENQTLKNSDNPGLLLNGLVLCSACKLRVKLFSPTIHGNWRPSLIAVATWLVLGRFSILSVRLRAFTVMSRLQAPAYLHSVRSYQYRAHPC